MYWSSRSAVFGLFKKAVPQLQCMAIGVGKKGDASYGEEKLYINLECAKFMGMGSKASKGRKKE